MIRSREIYKGGVLLRTENYDDGVEPLQAWQEKIAATRFSDRAIEDIIDALDAPTKAKIAPETLAVYEKRKIIRSEKPETVKSK